MRIQGWMLILVAFSIGAGKAHAWQEPDAPTPPPALNAGTAKWLGEAREFPAPVISVEEFERSQFGQWKPDILSQAPVMQPVRVVPTQFPDQRHAAKVVQAPSMAKSPIAAPTTVAASAVTTATTAPNPVRAPDVDPASHDREIQLAAGEIMDSRREVLDAGRALIQSRQPAEDKAEPTPGGSPALSNYYGDVTINYIVTPGADGLPRVAPSNPTPYTRFAQHEVLPPRPAESAIPHALDARAHAGQVYEGIVPMQEGMLPMQQGDFPIQGYVPMDPTQCCDCECCSNPVYCHRLGIFAEALYLRPGNVDVIYAREMYGCGPNASPAGGVGNVAPKDELGFRIGLNMPLSECSSIVAGYTWWKADSVSMLEAGPGAVIASTVNHPSTESCGSNSLRADAFYDIDMQMVELDYRRLIWGACDWAVNYNIGLRYGHLTQDFGASQIIGTASGLANVTSEIDFDGLGIGLGIDGMRRSQHSGLFLYGRGEAQFLGGDFHARYRQATQFGGGIDIASSASEFRLVSVLETELGVGWQTACGRFRVMTGYQAAGWFNTLLMKDYLNGIRTGELDPNAKDTMTLSGLVFRVEVRH